MSLSITDFQKIANGTSNAGSITLTSRGKLDKVNNHVGVLKGWNNKSISADTTLRVKDAFVNECISGDAEKMANRSPIKFDENGLASQFSNDGNRATFKIDDNLFDMSKPGAKSADLIKKLCDSLPDKTDRKFVSGLMNQSTVANIAVLVANAPDPARYNEEDPPTLRSMDAAGEHVANFVAEQSPILISQPTDLADSRYELRFDANDKSKATLTVSSNYRMIASNELCEGELISPGNADPHKQYSSFGKVGFSYRISITGLGTGAPRIASVGFTQDVNARDMQ